MKVRNRVREVRKKLRYSRRLLARESGIDVRTLGFIENRPNYEPTFRVARRLCEVLDRTDLFWIEQSDAPALAASA